MNFKNLAIQLGDAIKWDASVNTVHRTFSALVSFPMAEHTSNGITSARAQAVYDWVMTIAASSLPDADKIDVCRHAVVSLVLNDKEQARLTSLLPASGAPSAPTKTGGASYVNKTRIETLRAIKSVDFDPAKLVRLCEELNNAFASKSFLSTATLVRSIIDHVPPIFSCKDFDQVASNYAGSRSFKQSMQNLNNSSRKIADQHLHGQIRRRESLPNETQVDFSNDLDVLLAEIERLLAGGDEAK